MLITPHCKKHFNTLIINCAIQSSLEVPRSLPCFLLFGLSSQGVPECPTRHKCTLKKFNSAPSHITAVSILFAQTRHKHQQNCLLVLCETVILESLRLETQRRKTLHFVMKVQRCPHLLPSCQRNNHPSDSLLPLSYVVLSWWLRTWPNSLAGIILLTWGSRHKQNQLEGQGSLQESPAPYHGPRFRDGGKGNSVPLTSPPQIEGGHLGVSLRLSPAGAGAQQEQQKQWQPQQLQDAPARGR